MSVIEIYVIFHLRIEYLEFNNGSAGLHTFKILRFLLFFFVKLKRICPKVNQTFFFSLITLKKTLDYHQNEFVFRDNKQQNKIYRLKNSTYVFNYVVNFLLKNRILNKSKKKNNVILIYLQRNF
jgi:hypothetical protein